MKQPITSIAPKVRDLRKAFAALGVNVQICDGTGNEIIIPSTTTTEIKFYFGEKASLLSVTCPENPFHHFNLR